MSSQKKLARYPSEFSDLIDRACSRPQQLSFPSNEEAEKMRRELYNFRYALRKAARNNPDLLTHITLFRANRLSFRLQANILTVGEPYRLNEISHHEQSELRLWPQS